ncbi:hypothetical protein ABBQ38_002108 [Trebouxia sp. C0009 RCD-2024]
MRSHISLCSWTEEAHMQHLEKKMTTFCLSLSTSHVLLQSQYGIGRLSYAWQKPWLVWALTGCCWGMTRQRLLSGNLSRKSLSIGRRSMKLSFQDQLKLMAVTDILIGTHGSGMAMMMFLPPCGVTVEIKAYRHGLTDDFTHGHCNLARAANRSLLVWHNKHLEHTQAWEGPDGGADYHWWKQHHTFIPDAEIGAILDAAVQAWQTPIVERNFDAVQFLNTPETES